MARTVQELRDYVRNFLDTDSEELPDSLLDFWRQEAENRITRAIRSWTFYETNFTLSTTASDQSYLLSALTCVEDSTYDAEELTVVQGPRWQLGWLPHEEAEDRYSNYTGSAEPTFWSQWGDTLYLWPTPDAVYALTARGYRAPVSTVVAGTNPDVPAAFHELIGEFMLARAFEQQDDETLSAAKFAKFEQEFDVLRRRYTKRRSGRVSVFGSTRGRGQFGRLPRRLLYDFE